MVNQYSEQLSNPTVESSLRQWHEYDGLHRLVGSICPNCNRLFFPKRFVCPSCHHGDIQPYKFSGKGSIVNIDIQSLPPATVMGFREKMFRVMVGVKLIEGPVVISELVDVDNHKCVNIGCEVSTVIRKIARSANGDFKYAFKFKLTCNNV